MGIVIVALIFTVIKPFNRIIPGIDIKIKQYDSQVSRLPAVVCEA
jgi:hypothetical protein